MNNTFSPPFLINLWMAVTNLAALPTILYHANRDIRWLTTAIALASATMHLTEIKHGLPGILPEFSTFALHIDRAVAVGATTYLVFNYSMRLSLTDWLCAAIGAACMLIGEFRGWKHIPPTSTELYVAMHTVWHFVIYRLVWRI